jgi:uncharacterized caspase-like protein
MGAFGDLPHGRWVRHQTPGLPITREQRPSLIGGLIVAGALALLLWRAMSEIANGSDSRGISVGTPVPGPGASDRRYALIVAIEKYDDASLPSLEGPSRDAEELHGALMTHAGFPPANIRRVDGSGPDAMVPTRSNVLRAFHELLAEIPDDGNAMLLVAFTGHGLSADGKAYLLPKDAVTRGGASLLASTSIDFDVDVKERLVARRMKQLVLLVDSTMAGSSASPAARRLTSGFVEAVTIDARPPMEAVAVVHATAVGSSSYTDPGAKRSLFTHAFVEGVRGAAGRAPDGWITLGSLLRYVQEIVPERAKRIDPSWRQQPTVAIHGFRPNEIRFARAAARTASSSGDLRCALRAPRSPAGDLYVFDVAATSGSLTTTAVQAVHVVNGGLLGTPFGRPVPLTGPREWPIRRTAASVPLLAIAQTSIGQCAAYVEAAPVRAPVYRVRWQPTNAEGIPYKEVFRHATENRQGRTDVVAAGTDTLRDREGRITRVEYSCEGAFCGWSYHPEPVRGYSGDVTIKESRNGFSWRRRWEGDPAMDAYTAYYEMPVRVCVEGCP